MATIILSGKKGHQKTALILLSLSQCHINETTGNDRNMEQFNGKSVDNDSRHSKKNKRMFLDSKTAKNSFPVLAVVC